MSDDPSIQRLLENLGRAVARAMSTSDDVSEAVRLIRSEGFTLYLVLDREAGIPGEALEKAARRGARLPIHEQTLDSASAATSSGPDLSGDLETRPAKRFQLDQSDAGFLRSIGIDPSRTGKSRRR